MCPTSSLQFEWKKQKYKLWHAALANAGVTVGTARICVDIPTASHKTTDIHAAKECFASLVLMNKIEKLNILISLERTTVPTCQA